MSDPHPLSWYHLSTKDVLSTLSTSSKSGLSSSTLKQHQQQYGLNQINDQVVISIWKKTL